MSHHITEAKDLFYSYPDGHQAVNGLSFRIHHGESVGIIGANGAGKSTLLMLLTDILTPARGEVVIGEVGLTKHTLNMIRQRLGMVFQNPDDQLFMTTVHDDVAFGPRNLKIDEPQVEQRVVSALEQVGILHLKDRAPFHLSAGEKRAAAIATVLSMSPDILILDEPTSSLDPKSRRRLMNILRGFEHTKIITSHDLDMVLEICQRVIVMKDGQAIADGPAKDILTNQGLMEEAGLEIPLSLQGCPVCGRSKSGTD
ncbi:MAG: cobalt ABC transporter ATP-binding protein [Candidatus Edwardsbacteria bacterium RIFOXYD12_FULL_50_11]|uniref:Cobalt ABC transporter ATP-binding protein n=1 Tax=Candidatus Edwardsbacteria bacterium GWF2_54_11 TaxID=1817851 RepID=A0A1F5RIQ1_9BACT|nr:MAG: cobalt ABC transporter ATP-binding protein [Candidatus Edwardsbacteria bacterium RifOxyC12_full_54_24]OGF06182.1 MAG: cobalt ABC transporter ATP-binding protein [Candidatus Edwardsbacteria bacterium RifOxyA12_full_54_48]OGF12553.1 MAG: cobalt ABC transporter ATP-binding protein [Candidatus Edwardsbacteria bacterium GWE2_54_12]OGF13911.1 MAG: cobalt ABC transporter ATP-binding protein [Candidatus Edwardsbacteria bacterium GWF2_54_11]OGF17610.1 MAG: cobalt ABC transporter ATP-binding prot